MFDNLFGHSTETDFRAADAGGRNGYLVFSPEKISFHADFSRSANRVFEKGQVADIVIDSSIESSERFTFTRLFFLKMYALAFPKRTHTEHNSVFIIMTDGSEAGFALRDTNADEMYRKIEPFIAEFRNAASAQNMSSMAQELAHLHELHMSGALTDAEFTNAKNQLIGKG